MPLKPVLAPDSDPLDRRVKFSLSRRQVRDLELVQREFSMSRSWIIREALAAGLPLLVARLRDMRRRGFRPRGQLVNKHVAGPRRGPRSDGLRDDRWVRRPDVKPEGTRRPRVDFPDL